MNYYAEWGTDKYIRETYFPDFYFKGVMVEVGAGPPDFISMSKHFREDGWRCICIDPNPNFVRQHKEVNSEIYQFACSYENKDTTFKIVDSRADYNWSDDVNGVSISALELRLKSNRNLPYYEIPVQVRTLDSILEYVGAEHVDYLSVDVEGWELEVMRGFDIGKYSPSVVCLENMEHYKITYEEHKPHIDTFTNYMESVGYKLDKEIIFNYIYIKK